MRRIVVNGRFFAQPRTGVQRYGVETLRSLDELLSRHPQFLEGVMWQLALPHDAVDVPLLENFEIQTLQLFSGHLWEQVSLAAFARGAYLINLNYSAPLLKRMQLVSVHDASVRAHPQTYSWSYRLLSNLLVTTLAPRVHSLMTASHFSAQELKRHYGLQRNDIVVERSGWEHVRMRPEVDEVEVLLRHGLVSGGYLLAVGSLKWNKNFGIIPRALNLLGGRQRLPVAVAGGRDARVYQGIDAPPPDAMKLLGFVSDEELNVLYRHASWFIFPSLYEGFGLPPLEAMANGCPVLAAHAASIPEIYDDAVLYFDPNDPASLAACLRDVTTRTDAAALRETMKQRAAARMAIYRWDANARILLDRLVRTGIVAPATTGGATMSLPNLDLELNTPAS
ncbi:MAG TPA: glycosyltransferase family 1 protein [Burkholderiaceae bacterium]|nr:glycosyltransferase family 1 protein [Burkholderiaceae bacterium]